MRSDPYQASNFVIEIEGLLVGGFSECSGLEVESEVQEHREGGVNDYVHRFAGATRYPPLVLRRGITLSDVLWRWYRMTTAGQVRRRNGTIFLLNRAHIAVVSWDFKDAFPYKWSGPELRAEMASVAFESVELAHRGLSLSPGGVTLARIGAGIAASANISGGLF
jgi:phage tail-like protein